jgi:hypothetical protein
MRRVLESDPRKVLVNAHANLRLEDPAEHGGPAADAGADALHRDSIRKRPLLSL